MVKHLVVFKKGEAEKILSGLKTIELRFSKGKIPPFGMVSSEDLVYIKISSEEIIGQFRVKKVIFFDGLENKDFEQIKQQYNESLEVDQKFWDKAKNCKYGTLIFIGSSLRFITSPIKLPKNGLKALWRVLD